METDISHWLPGCPGNFPPHMDSNGLRPSSLTCNDTLEKAETVAKRLAEKVMLMLCIVQS